MRNVDRRTGCKIAIAGATGMFLPIRGRAYAAVDPHFFVTILAGGGMDASCAFDARPLAMTQAGLIQNYLGTDPMPWIGANGGNTLAHATTQALAPLREYFSVVNGVMMATDFDSHPQNVNFLLTGNSSGGNYGMIEMARAAGKRPIDYVALGGAPRDLKNGSGKIDVRRASFEATQRLFKSASSLDGGSPLGGYLRARLDANASGDGQFRKGIAGLRDAFALAPELRQALLNVKLPDNMEGDDATVADFKIALALLKVGASGAIHVTLPGEFDAHGPSQAVEQPALIKRSLDTVAAIIRLLRDTSFDAQRSFYDVTTFMVASEMNRTMRQEGFAVSETGTDHNMLGNSILVGGKGIRCGMVFGASDLETEAELAAASGAHKAIDPKLLRVMGKPIDLVTGNVVAGKPEVFHSDDYLSAGNIGNALLRLSGVPESRQWRQANNGAIYKPMTALLKQG